MEQIVEFIKRVQDHVVATDHLLHSLRPGVPTHPIPFFGRLHEAGVLTVAMNPSAGEFAPDRRWPTAMSAAELTQRLLGYFTDAPVQPHPWFEKAETPLRPLSLRYTGSVAHLDVVPRATRTLVGSDADIDAFLAVARADAWVFFNALDLATRARLVILTGTLTKRYYVDAWLSRQAPTFGWQLGKIDDRSIGRPGWTFHSLRNKAGRDVPVFFTSVSPSARPPANYGTNFTKALAHLERLCP